MDLLFGDLQMDPVTGPLQHMHSPPDLNTLFLLPKFVLRTCECRTQVMCAPNMNTSAARYDP